MNNIEKGVIKMDNKENLMVKAVKMNYQTNKTDETKAFSEYFEKASEKFLLKPTRKTQIISL